MAKNDFRVTSIFKVIIRICMKNFEFCGKTSKFLSKRYLLIPVFFFSILKLLKYCHQLHQLLIITNFHFYHLWSDPDENLKNKNWCQILNICIVTSNKLYFCSLLVGRHKCSVNNHRELNFCHKFRLFIQVWECMDYVFDCSIGSPY